MKPGTRVRMNDACPWPERRGCLGVVVAPREGVYPMAVAGCELILLDADPLQRDKRDRWWTCQTSRSSFDVVTD